ncbi:hypothetical protein [Arthrobacter caoxuetaonis]|uniref:Uncharacterized protein n=1 Tax=Arthrobacter caoxuetaonis TaxID=2886935 RepID=A0A9X1SDG4_9MICC|nr:hypothetical protein [Arthrobacter caoxuetaonis]MCC3296774.1 hypothetical protein [Arthrobacter caoxuetaonis]USQ56408.1 hypothetical protein NF551_11680 [Arthrobacter caoxuetaonis]
MSRPQDSAEQAGRPPAALLISAILVLEALGLLGVAAWYIYNLLTATATSLGGAVFTLILVIVLAVWLLVVGHFFFRGMRWTRAAALVWQLFMIVLAVPTLQGGVVLVGLLLLVPAAAVILLLFTKPVVAWTSRISGDAQAF